MQGGVERGEGGGKEALLEDEAAQRGAAARGGGVATRLGEGGGESGASG